MQTLTIEELSDILAESTIISTSDHAGMLIHNITHPTLGRVTTVQADNGGLLITG